MSSKHYEYSDEEGGSTANEEEEYEEEHQQRHHHRHHQPTYEQEDEEENEVDEGDETTTTAATRTGRRSSRAAKEQSKKRKKSSTVSLAAAAAVTKSVKKSVSTSKLTSAAKSGGGSSKTKSSKTKKSVAASSTDTNLLDQLKTVILDLFGYEFNDFDINFLTQIFTQLPRLNEVWSEIGFDQQTKQARLDEFYKTVFDTVDDMISNELQLKEQIEKSIEKQRKQVNEICYELQRGFEEIKSLKALDSLPMLEKDDVLRKELKRLQSEKQKRLDEHKKLIDQEDELCDKLNEPRMLIKKPHSSSARHVVPSEAELAALSAHIVDLNKILDDRRRRMINLQNDIVTLNSELDMSKSDSFAELIVFESIDKLPTLSVSDLQRAEELRDDLVRRNVEIVGQIKELRVKIKDLWTKLNCENSEDKMLQQMVSSESTMGSDFGSLTKRELLSELTIEYERCYAIKMENMQRFTESIRSDIRVLCDKMFMLGDEDGLDVILNDQNYNNEQLLEAHEEKLEHLRFVYAESADLFDRVSEWSKVWKDYCDFEKKTQDPQRFKERGYSMLEEERQRKTFKNMLPKLEEEIVRLATDYETNNNRPFCIHGEPYRQYVENKKTIYEESKLMERKEKQIMRDTLKKTESKFGSKPVTPLALKNKRGGVCANSKLINASSMASESHLQTPSRLTSLRSSNLSKLATPTATNQSRIGGPSSKSILHQVAAKSKAIKRKSRTPGKNSQSQRRRSKLIMEQLAQESNIENETTLCSTNTMTSGGGGGGSSSAAVSTSKLSGYSSSGYSMSSKSNNTSSVSNASSKNFGYQKTVTMTATSTTAVQAKTTTTGSKNPPLSASAKYNKMTLERMTSTASNTLIEDEHCDLNEITQYANAAATAANSSQCLVEAAAYKLNNCDVNYFEFSRNLSKPIHQGSSKAPLGDSTNSNGSTRSGLVRIRK